MMLRLTFYVVTGIMTALLGWSFSQILLNILIPLKQWPQLVLIPLITVFLAVGMVIIEIFMSNPTRPSLNLKIALKPLLFTVIIGLLVGTIVGGLLQLLYLPNLGLGERTLRLISWWSIGISVGIIESSAWEFYGAEAGDRKLRRMRQLTSFFGASLSSIIAAGIFEWIRNSFDLISQEFRQLEEPLGFCILGTLLAITLTFSTSPSYSVALRAGKGFEYRGNTQQYISIDTTFVPSNSSSLPIISQKSIKQLQFVANPDKNQSEFQIQEGLSIKLPGKKVIHIGGVEKKEMPNGKIIGSDIYLPNMPPHLASIEVGQRESKLKPNPKNYQQISINGEVLKNSEEKIIYHNTVIAFHNNNSQPNEPEMYRFVYYNRFLDPES
ncbi:MAG: hypothetical protein QNJ64_06615 [Crocosphaera sp.]|nr:hypothetical protein [Crocosphaera sp.]